LGGNGTISVTGNVAPRLVHEMIMAAMAGDKETALALDIKLAALHKNLFIQSNPIPVKWAVAEMGLMGKGIRLPLTPLSVALREPLKTAMKQAGLL
jgi:4-hydroxy-tetrahydrodipicolinate synthase